MSQAYKSARLEEAYIAATRQPTGLQSFNSSRRINDHRMQSKQGLLPTSSTSYSGPHKGVNRKTLSMEEMNDRRATGLCYFCDEKYVFGHKCKNVKQLYLLEIEEQEGMEVYPVIE